ncbi:MAG: hypothetical protein ABIZ04_19505 [Opitutus sp.]
MSTARPLRAITLSLLFLATRALYAQVPLPLDGEGVQVTTQLEVATGPILSRPPALPVPVLPGSDFRFTLHGIASNEIADVSWSKNLVPLNLHGRELSLPHVSSADTGQYIATVTTIQGDVALASRVLHVSAFPRQRLLNLSTRAAVTSSGATVFAGFVVDVGPGDATSSKQLLIRAVGPSLADYGVQNALTDPKLRLFRGDGSIIEISDALRDPDRLAEAGARMGAAPLRRDRADTGVLISLRGGVYTAQVISASHQTGEVLLEIYEVTP